MEKTDFYIHDSSILSPNAIIGKGCKIWHFSHIREGVVIGTNVIIGQNVYIDRDVKIGDNCKIQNNTSIYKGVTIGDNVFIGPSVVFTNDLYPVVEDWNDDKIKNTIIEDHVSIGANATILAGVKIGFRSLIGAGSLVSKNIPKNSIAYGNPASIKSETYRKD